MKKRALFICLFSLLAMAQSQEKPNVIYFLVDNLGMGELSCYDGGLTRGAETPRLDQIAKEGFQLWNFAPETQCTPSRSALMTGRYSIRSGNHTVYDNYGAILRLGFFPA